MNSTYSTEMWELNLPAHVKWLRMALIISTFLFLLFSITHLENLMLLICEWRGFGEFIAVYFIYPEINIALEQHFLRQGTKCHGHLKSSHGLCLPMEQATAIFFSLVLGLYF